jgi:hypothetical protein
LLFIKRESSAGDKAMDMKMIGKHLRPGMEDTDEPDLTLNFPFRITGKCLQCLAHSCKQVVQHDFWVTQYNRIQFMRNGEDHMKIITRQKIGLPVIEPFFLNHSLAFRAMSVSAGIVGYSFKTALITLFDMASELGGPANLNFVHHFKFFVWQHILLPVFFAVETKNISHFVSVFHFIPPRHTWHPEGF